MTAAIAVEFHAGGLTTDMVEEVWAEVLGELATPGSPVHDELGPEGLDGPLVWPDTVTAVERYGNIGTTIVVFGLQALATYEVERLWQDVVRPRIKRRFHRDAGEWVEPVDWVASGPVQPGGSADPVEALKRLRASDG